MKPAALAALALLAMAAAGPAQSKQPKHRKAAHLERPFSCPEGVADVKTGPKGLELIKSFEGCMLTAYKCPAGVWTVGVGSTGPHVKPGMTITQEQATELLQRDLARFEEAVTRLVTVPLVQSQFDALVSLAFNIGVANFEGSTLLKKLNAGDLAGAADQFQRWSKAKGKTLAGLARRRSAEAALFLSAQP